MGQIITKSELDNLINSGTLSSVYVLYGEEDFEKRDFFNKIYENTMTASGMEVFNFTKISFAPSENSFDEALDLVSSAFSSFPMGQDKYLIFIEDLDLESIQEKDFKNLIETLKLSDDSFVVIILLRNAEFKNVYRLETTDKYKKLQSVSTMVNFAKLNDYSFKKYILSKLKEYNLKISDGAIEAFRIKCNNELSIIDSEISKLSFYAKYNKIDLIDVDVVNLITSQAVLEDMPAFDLQNALQGWKIAEVINAIENMKDLKEDPSVIVASMANVYSNMLLCKSAMEEGKDIKEIMSELKLKEFPAKKLMESVKMAPLNKIKDMIKLTLEADVELKNAMVDRWVVLDVLISKIYVPRSLLC